MIIMVRTDADRPLRHEPMGVVPMAPRTQLAQEMEFPPVTEQPNVFPLSWRTGTEKMEEIWSASQREVWDPAMLSWDTFDPESYTWEE